MKIYNRFYLLGSLSCFFCLFVSCSLSEELDKINDITSIQASASFNANILNETIFLKDFITTDIFELKENTVTGDYSFGFEKNSDYKIESVVFPEININPLFLTLPPQYINPPITIPIGEYDLPKVINTFNLETPRIGTSIFPNGFNITEIKLKPGAKITLNLNNEFNLGGRIKVTIPKLIKNGVAYSKIFDNIAANTISNLIIDDISGYTLFTEAMSIEFETTIKKTSITPISGSKMSFSTTIDIADHYEYIEGFLGEILLKPDPILIDVSIPDGFKKITTSDRIIKEAIITLTVSENNLILPFDLDLESEGITLEKTTITNSAIFQFKIHNLNLSNLAELKLKPIVTLNKGLTSGINKLTDISSLTFNAKLDVPMDITAKDLIYEQEGDNLFYEASIKESDIEIKDGKISLIGSINSDIPLGASVQVSYRKTANGGDLLSLFDNPVGIKLGETLFDITVTKEKFDLIKTYPFQVVKITLNGSGKINSSQKISFKIGLAAKGTITVKI